MSRDGNPPGLAWFGVFLSVLSLPFAALATVWTISGWIAVGLAAIGLALVLPFVRRHIVFVWKRAGRGKV